MDALGLTIKTFVARPSLIPTLTVVTLLAAALAFITSVQAFASGRTASGCRPGATRSLVTPTRTYAVEVSGLVRAYRRPGGAPFARFGRYNVNGVPTVFAALEAVMGPRCKAAWYRVMLPLKPNGRTGYVRARYVRLRSVRARILVDLSSRRLMVVERGRLVLRTRAAVGARGTPTPVGRFYVNQRFRDDPSGPYGWAAIGISAFSEVLTGWPQGGPVAIHGTNRPSLLGLPVSNGCIRVSNPVVRRLWRLAPTGTPVFIRR
jgi:lipoprotein-anchoring transpeptidase ErfK/SrfK